MTTIASTHTSLPEPGNASAWQVQWKDLRAGDVGAPVTEYNYAARSAQIEGEFGAVVIEGSNDGESYYALATVREASMTILEQSCRLIRPRALSGGPFTVTMLLRRTTPRL